MSLRNKKNKSSEENTEITFIRNDEREDKESPTKLSPSDSVAETTNEEISNCNQYSSYSSLEVNYDNSRASELSSISSLESPIEDVYYKCHNSSRFGINNRTRIEPSILNNFLDFLSTCFWKCSKGCQQLPEKQY